MRYIQVLLPLRLEWEPWYSTDAPVRTGDRVKVVLSRKEYIGVVLGVYDIPGISTEKIQPVLATDTGLEPISAPELQLWRFIASYYLCTLGEVYKCAYPAVRVKNEEIELRKRERALKKGAAVQEHLTGLNYSGVPAGNYLNCSASSGTGPGDGMQLAPETGEGSSTPAKPLLLWSASRSASYIKAARHCLDSGLSALVLVPDMNCAAALEEKLKGEFQDRLTVFNSMKTPVQRRKVEKALRDLTDPQVILATRSAIFLPWRDLGLVIIDEEQDPSYKQAEPSPRYHARDIALMLAKIHGADTILGSSCPSLTTLLNCKAGKFALECGPLPELRAELIDMRAERRKRGVSGDFSFKACDAVREAAGLTHPDGFGKEGAIVTIVRSPWQDEAAVASQCEKLFPGLDPQIISAYSASRSLTHSAVTLVLQADSLFPKDDFRADERALQALLLLAERTDRLVLQCSSAEHPVLGVLSCGAGRQAVEERLEALLEERRTFAMPPFSREIRVYDRRGALCEDIFLPRGSSLERAKQDIRQKYSSDHIIDVDPQ
ncbi:MAG: hypothetical protein KBS55_04870 [Bacteroidales bacterium]|nr:hypothetical protein [Candidatus Cryptobacteroides aphodequi]